MTSEPKCTRTGMTVRSAHVYNDRPPTAPSLAARESAGILRDVAQVALAAWVVAKPEGAFWAPDWVSDVLCQRFEGLAPPTQAMAGDRAWCVGGVVGNEALVRGRPIVRDQETSFLSDLLLTPAPCTLAAYTMARSKGERLPSTAISRFQRFVGVFGGPDHDAVRDVDTAKKWRLEQARQLPPFLHRDPQDTETDVVFRLFLAELYKSGGLGSVYAPPSRVAAALHAVEALIPPELPGTLFVTDGRTLGILNRSRDLVVYTPPFPPDRRRRPTDHAGDHAQLFVVGTREPDPSWSTVGERLPPGAFALAATRPTVLHRAP